MINTFVPISSGAVFFNRNLDPGMIREDLQSQELPRQTNAVKQVIAFMTIGKDMSMHFNDVANLVSSMNLQLKKLVYLYLMQNSRTQPEKAVLQAGTFSHDTQHESPLIRGIALRTMSSMQVVAMVDFLTNPILRCLKDSDAYVRRTAVFASLKLYSMAPSVFQESGVGAALMDLFGDPIASVVASVVAVISELLTQNAPTYLANAMFQRLNTLLAAVSDCSEWQQHYLLEGVALFFQQKQASFSISVEEADIIVSRVLPQLSSANAAVVGSAVKIVILFVHQFLGSTMAVSLTPVKIAQLEAKYLPRIAPPLMSLVMSQRFEMRYVAIRNVELLIQLPKMRDVFIPYLSSFFVKYDDSVFVKMEKLEVLVNLVNKSNWEAVLAELAEYAAEVDVEFVRKAVRSIGLVAVKVENAAGSCVEKLVTLIETQINYIVQEAAVVVQLILRQYRDRFAGVIAKLCSALSILDDADSKAAIAWVVGEFADRVENAPAVLGLFFDSFNDEVPAVQLAVLTAVAKAFLSCTDVSPENLQAMLEKCLSKATRSDDPDVRDRAYFYWRLIAADIHSARDVILASKPPMTDFTVMDRVTLNELVTEIGCVSSVNHKLKRLIFSDEYHVAGNGNDGSDDEDDAQSKKDGIRDSSNVLNGVSEGVTTPVTATSSSASAAVLSPTSSSATNADYRVVVPTSAGNGVEIAMAWTQNGTYPQALFRFSLAKNATTTVCDPRAASLTTIVRVTMIQLNVNLFGLGIAQEVAPKEVKAGEVAYVSLSVNCNNGRKPVRDIQTAVKVEPIGVLYFNAPALPPRYLLLPSTGVDPVAYVASFKSLSPSWSLPPNLENKCKSSANKLAANTLKVHNITLVHQKEIAPKICFHLYCETIARQKLYVELTTTDWNVSALVVRSSDDNITHIIGEHVLSVVCEN